MASLKQSGNNQKHKNILQIQEQLENSQWDMQEVSQL